MEEPVHVIRHDDECHRGGSSGALKSYERSDYESTRRQIDKDFLSAVGDDGYVVYVIF